MKRILIWLLTAALVLAAVPACAAGYTARTPMDAGDSVRNDNIRRAAWSLNQARIGYGDTFSFNGVVGPRTQSRGYGKALNGRGVEVVGGGVGQVASTLYLALLGLNNSGVYMTELSTYGSRYAGSYVASGDLAVLVDYNAGTDFRFTNYAADELIIEMWQSGGDLYCAVTLSESFAWSSEDGFTWSDGDFAVSPPVTRCVATSVICSGDDDSVLHNVALAANSVTDTMLLPGDAFSFNTVVGPREARYGYVPAVNGRGAKVTGGGVAQVASALWLSIRNLPNVSIVEKSTYGTRYNQSYVASSSDAILTDYNAGTDFVFRYAGTGSLTLYTWLEGGMLNCAVYESD